MSCHFLLQCVKVKSGSEVAQLCPTLRDPMDCSLPGPSVHGIFQARVLEWSAMFFSNGHKFEQTLGDDEEMGILVCCSPWGHKKSDIAKQLTTTREGWIAKGSSLHRSVRKKESLSPNCPPQSLVLAVGAQCEFHSYSHGKRQVEGALGRNPSSRR